MNTTTPERAFPILRASFRRAIQWRLWLLYALTSLACALLAALPAWTWLSNLLDLSVHSDLVANGQAPNLLIEALMRRDAPLAVLGQSQLVATILLLLASPLLAGATITAARSRTRLGFGDLLRGAVAEYGPLLRLLLWSAVPLGFALLVMSLVFAGNEGAHKQAIVASELDTGRTLAYVLGGVLFVLAHASLEAGRGWLAADGRLRSALKAWWRGVRLLAKRPVAVLAIYLATTAFGLLLAAALLLLRPYLGTGSVAAFGLGLLLSGAIAMALAWARIARLFGMRTLAEDMHAHR